MSQINSRKEKLKKLYESIPNSPEWVDDFNKIYKDKLRNKKVALSNEELKELVKIIDEMSDDKIKVKDLNRVINYERKIQKECEEFLDKLEGLLNDLTSPDELEPLKHKIDLILEVIEICYVTLNKKDYEKYRDRYNKLIDEWS